MLLFTNVTVRKHSIGGVMFSMHFSYIWYISVNGKWTDLQLVYQSWTDKTYESGVPEESLIMLLTE